MFERIVLLFLASGKLNLAAQITSFRKECHVKKGTRFHSQNHEDQALYKKYFCEKRNGVYVELGALDGQSLSNTKFFEDHLGWTGVLIEGNPVVAENLIKNRGHRNKVFAPTAVCSDKNGTIPFVVNGKYGHASAGNANLLPEALKRDDGHSQTVLVHCEPISSLLVKSEVTKIDLFSLDVEGAELEVLQTLDFDKTPVGLFLVELDGNNPDKDNAVRDLLKSHGYHKPNDGWNIQDACIGKDDRPNGPGPGCPRNEVWLASGIN